MCHDPHLAVAYMCAPVPAEAQIHGSSQRPNHLDDNSVLVVKEPMSMLQVHMMAITTYNCC